MFPRSAFNLYRHVSSTKTLFRRNLSFSKRNLSHGSGQNSNFNARRRRWGRDEILALTSWLVVGSGAFVLIGTTTSASIALLLANSLQFQGKFNERNWDLRI